MTYFGPKENVHCRHLSNSWLEFKPKVYFKSVIEQGQQKS
jgi:hypothetical protein